MNEAMPRSNPSISPEITSPNPEDQAFGPTLGELAEQAETAEQPAIEQSQAEAVDEQLKTEQVEQPIDFSELDNPNNPDETEQFTTAETIEEPAEELAEEPVEETAKDLLDSFSSDPYGDAQEGFTTEEENEKLGYNPVKPPLAESAYADANAITEQPNIAEETVEESPESTEIKTAPELQELAQQQAEVMHELAGKLQVAFEEAAQSLNAIGKKE